VVTLAFPKKDFLQICLADGNYRRLSSAYDVFTPLKPWFSVDQSIGYHAIWSRQVLQIHWLATWLGPLALAHMLYRRQNLGLLLGLFALFSFLVPAVVDFGPVYEFEYFRWQYAAGWGFAAVVGMSLGLWYDSAASRPKRAAMTVGLLFFLAVNVAPFFLTVLPYRGQSADKVDWRGFWRPLPIDEYLRQQQNVLGVTPMDTRMALALLAHATPGQSVLANFPTATPQSIHLESTLSGLTALRFVGHSLTVEGEPVGTTPYHMSAAGRAFWGSLDPLLLRQLGVDWLYVRPGPEVRPGSLTRLRATRGLSVVASFVDAAGPYYLFRVDLPPLPMVVLKGPVIDIEADDLRVMPMGPALARACYYDGTVTLRNQTSRTFPKGTLLATGFDPDVHSRERVVWALDAELKPGRSVRQSFPLVASHEAGEKSLHFAIEEAAGSERFSPLTGMRKKVKIQ
jgi:hypothetical protein